MSSSTPSTRAPAIMLSATDCLFLRAEQDLRPIHWTFVVQLASGEEPLTYVEVANRVTERANQRDLYRLRLAAPNQRRPRFVLATDFDPAAHVRSVTLADESEMQDWLGNAVAAPMPTDVPLWDATLVTEESSGTQYLALRVHHCITDGMAGQAFIGLLADTSSGTVAEFDRFLVSERFEVDPLPWRQRLRVIAAGNRSILSGGLKPRGSQVRSGRRKVASLSLRASDFRRNARAHGASTNEFVLSAVAAAYNSSRLEAGVAGAELRVQFPVTLDRSLRHTGNAASIAIITTSGTETDAGAHVDVVSNALREAGRSDGARDAIVATAPLKYLPWRLQKQLTAKSLEDICDISVGVNPGLGAWETVLGRRVVSAAPYVPIVDYPVSVTSVLYRDQFMVGIVTDPVAFPGDVDAFVQRLGAILGVDETSPQEVRTA